LFPIDETMPIPVMTTRLMTASPVVVFAILPNKKVTSTF
jgi:hypothetical protein